MKSTLPPPPPSYRRSHKLLGSGMHKLRISCGHFAELSLQAMDRPLTTGEKLRHRFHHIICALCRDFEKQMHSLPALVRASFAGREAAKPDPDFLASVRASLEQTAREADSSGDPNS